MVRRRGLLGVPLGRAGELVPPAFAVTLFVSAVVGVGVGADRRRDGRGSALLGPDAMVVVRCWRGPGGD